MVKSYSDLLFCWKTNQWSHSWNICGLFFLFNLNVPVIQCGPPPPAPQNGSSSHTGTRFSDKARYTCDDGYRLEGNRVILCEATGQWQTAPTCESKHTKTAISESGVFREFASIEHLSSSFIFIRYQLFSLMFNQSDSLISPVLWDPSDNKLQTTAANLFKNISFAFLWFKCFNTQSTLLIYAFCPFICPEHLVLVLRIITIWYIWTSLYLGNDSLKLVIDDSESLMIINQ